MAVIDLYRKAQYDAGLSFLISRKADLRQLVMCHPNLDDYRDELNEVCHLLDGLEFYKRHFELVEQGVLL